MKTMSCKQLGGPCDHLLTGETADEVIKAQDAHLKQSVADGDETHLGRAQRDEGPLEAPDRRDGVVPDGQARLRRTGRLTCGPGV